MADEVKAGTEYSSEKIKMMFSLLGEIVVMFLSFIKIFKKNDKKD